MHASFLGRLPSILLASASVVVTALSIAGVFVFGGGQGYLDRVSGTWTALAVDLAGGQFYRPLVAADGYGGTRYFPLHFVLHAAVIKTIGDPVRAGQILAALCVSALAIGVYLLLRAVDASPLLAVGGAAALLVSQTTQGALLSIHGDALPVALNVLGLALCARPGDSRRRTLAAAVLFTLAFAAKPTAVYGVCAAAVWLSSSNRRRSAALLLSATAAGALGTIALMQIASSGRAFDVLWAGSATGVSLLAFLDSPLSFARNVLLVPETLAFLQLGVAAAVALIIQGAAMGLPVVFFVAAFLMSVPIFAFEGTASNHLIDLHAASVVAIAGYIASQRPSERGFATTVLAIAMLGASLSLVTPLTRREVVRRFGTLDQALALIPDRERPILAENALVPIAAHQRPYLLDSYMFRMLGTRTPSFDESMLEALSRRQFGAVVLDGNPHEEPGRTLYRHVFFGGRFLDTLDRYYEEKGHVGQRVVFLPKER